MRASGWPDLFSHPGLAGAVVLGVAGGLLAGVVHPLAPIALVLGGAVVLYGLLRPIGLLIAFLGILFLRPTDFFPALAPLMLGKLVVAGALGAMVLDRALRREVRWPKAAATPWMAGVVATVLLSSLRGSDPGASLATFNEVFVKIILLYGLLLFLVNTPARALAVQGGIVAFTSVLGLYAIQLKLTGQANIEGSRAGAIGLLGDPNDLALSLLMSPAFLIMAWPRARGLGRLAIGLALIAVVGGLIATQSRGGLLGFAAMGYMVVRARLRSRVATFALVGAGLLGLVLVAGVASRQTVSTSGIDESAQGRLDAWYAGYRMFRARPITGVGYERFPDNYPVFALNPVEWGPKAAHSTWVKALAEVGLLGLIPFLAMVAVTLRSAWALHPRRGPPTVAAAVPESLLPMLTGLLVSASFLSQTWNWFIYIAVGLVAALEAQAVPAASELEVDER
ncbi:MAG: O-antigen ligase family protein [Myxococcales bacterium]|nr:O-antigen ligase family protein [Myxococcales bacterium]